MLASDKVFGLENFGNTCYCNSVVQALYHTRPFRDYILGLSPVDRPPRLQTPGSTEHPAVTEQAKKAQQASSKQQEVVAGSQKSGFSIFKSKFSKSNTSATENGAGPGNASSAFGSPVSSSGSHTGNICIPHLATSVGNVSITSDSDLGSSTSSVPQQLDTNLATTPVGPLPMVGFLENSDLPAESALAHATSSIASMPTQWGADSESLIDTRKRNALLRGPIVNVNQSFSHEYNMEESIVTALKDLFDSITENEKISGVASPARLVEVLKSENELFRSSMHQDAQEFLNFLLNRVIEEENLHSSGSNGISHRGEGNVIDEADPKKDQSRHPNLSAKSLFTGELTNEMRCLYCETVTKRSEPFYDFSLETLPDTSVYNCLQQFSASEVLGGSNKFYCDVCGGHQEALKRMKIKKAPPILVLHLKRFKFSEDENRNTKLLHRVLYSKHLRLPMTTDDCKTPEKLYELSSVIVHLGGGPYQGHYVVVTRTPHGWLLFDDEIVDKVDEAFVYRFFGDRTALSTAYLLVYQEINERQHEANILASEVNPHSAANQDQAPKQPAHEPPLDHSDGKKRGKESSFFSVRRHDQSS